MALTDISTNSVAVLEFSRGNVGTLVDMSSIKGVFEVPAGAGAGAVFPSESDVDIGVTFGPTGSDFIGTLEQPAETDVLVGVQYGADGIEFTGEASGGGGLGFVPMIID